MQTKNLVIFAAGVLTGYLLTQFISGKIEGVQSPIPQQPEPIAEVDLTAKTAECDKKLMESMMTLRFGSEMQMEEYKNQFMKDCLSS